MRVRVLTSRVGITPDGNSWSEQPGDVVELPDDEAEQRIALGKCEPAELRKDLSEAAHAFTPPIESKPFRKRSK